MNVTIAELNMRYWRLETELCFLANKLGMRKEELLSNPNSVPPDIREEVSKILWEKANCLLRLPKKKRLALKLVVNHPS